MIETKEQYSLILRQITAGQTEVSETIEVLIEVAQAADRAYDVLDEFVNGDLYLKSLDPLAGLLDALPDWITEY